MITCKVKPSTLEVEVSGHAMSAPLGQDLICAAVTAITFGTANYITFHNKGSYEEGDNLIKLNFKERENMIMMMFQLKTIAFSYPDNLEIVEVQ